MKVYFATDNKVIQCHIAYHSSWFAVDSKVFIRLDWYTSLLQNIVAISGIKGEKVFFMATVVEKHPWVSVSSAHS